MKAVIIDNNKTVRDGLRAMLLKLCSQVTQIYEAGGVESGFELIVQEKPQIVFTDVEMDDGTGFDLIQKLPFRDFQLIFITAYNKYAVNAFKFSAIDFLLKPIDPIELVASVNKASESFKNRDLEQQIKLLKDNLSSINQKISDKKVALYESNIIHYIKVSDIIFCKSDASYTIFHIVGGKKIMVSRLLKEYEELFDGLGFLRTHNSYLINTQRILRFDKSDGGQLIMEEDHAVQVSTRKKEQVLEILSKL